MMTLTLRLYESFNVKMRDQLLEEASNIIILYILNASGRNVK